MNILKDFSIYTLFSIIEKGLPFILITIYTYFLSENDLGIIANIDILLIFFFTFSLLNVDDAVVIEYFRESTYLFNKYFSNAIFITLISLVLAILTIFFIKWHYGITDFLKINIYWLLGLPFIAFGRSIMRLQLCILQIKKKAFQYGLISTLYITFIFLIVIYLIVVKRGDFTGILWAYLIGAAIITSVCLMNFWRNSMLFNGFNKKIIQDILVFALPLLPLRLMHIVINSSDRFFITYFIGLEESGIYHIGYTIGSIIFILNTVFEKSWTPYLYEKLSSLNVSSNLFISKVSLVFIIVMLITFCILCLLAKVYFNYIVDTKFVDGQIYVFWVALSYLIFTIYQIYAQIIFYHKKTNILLGVSLISIILNLFLNYYMIGFYGSIGAAYATVITFANLSLMTAICAKPYFNFYWLSSLRYLLIDIKEKLVKK